MQVSFLTLVMSSGRTGLEVHDIFLESHHVDDHSEQLGIAVLCSCGALLAESNDYGSAQMLLDEAVDAAWHHNTECTECSDV